MSAGYASRLKEYPNKGVCGLPELQDTTRSYTMKRKRFLDFIQKASGSIVVLTGAGISTSAGIPDFRGPQGIWTAEVQKKQGRQPQQQQQQQQQKKKTCSSSTNENTDSQHNNSSSNRSENNDSETNSSSRKRQREEDSSSTASSSATAANANANANGGVVAGAGGPKTMMASFDQAQPTVTHCAIRHLIQQGVVSFCVTQNVDGLHVRSGISRDSLAVLHGCVFTEKCETCAVEHFRDSDVGGMSFQRTGRFCEQCQSPLRDTLLDWKDPLPEDDYQRAMEYCQGAKLVVCLGTSLRIEPAGSLPTLARKFIIVNLQETPYDSQACLIVRAKVDTVMRHLMHDLGFSDEHQWNVPAKHIGRLWKNPHVDSEYARKWWQLEKDHEEEESSSTATTTTTTTTKEAGPPLPPIKVSSEEDDSDEKASETESAAAAAAAVGKETVKKGRSKPVKTTKPKTEDHKPRRQYGRIFLERRGAKRFPNGLWYMGTITKYSPKTKLWWIQYDDGDHEHLNWPELQQALKDHDEQQQQQQQQQNKKKKQQEKQHLQHQDKQQLRQEHF